MIDSGDGSPGAKHPGLVVRLRQESPIPLDASFDCAPGELLALVGPSGSGKTTILRAIAGLTSVQQGRVTVAGEVWLNSEHRFCLAPQRRCVGLVFQHYALFPHMTAVDNVMTALSEGSRLRRRARAQELLELVHLAGLESAKPGALSGGQQQRVALARALARDPAVLLLDEPFSAVDQVTRRKLQRELASLRNRLHIPIVLVTHDLDEAGLLADRMCILHRGETLQIGSPRDLITRPKDARVARLVNASNVFQGRIVGQEPALDRTVLRWRDYTLECRYFEEFPVGANVDWLISPQDVLLHQRVRPSRGERENPVGGIIGELVTLGEMTSATIWVDGERRQTLAMSISAHVARRNELKDGERVSVSLLKQGIHLMRPIASSTDVTDEDTATDKAESPSHRGSRSDCGHELDRISSQPSGED